MIEELAHQIQQRKRLTAVGIAIGHRDNPIEVAVSGIRRHKSSIPIQPTDKWHIGSITKSITATMIAMLVEEGVLKFESTLPELLPEISMHPLWAECTLEHLLTHTSGLPPNFPMRLRKVDPKTTNDLLSARREAIRETLTKPPKTPCGNAFSYSNIGYTIIGHIAETQSNSCYEDLIRKRIFEPFGLDSAGFGAPVGEGPEDQPLGHHAALWYRKPADPFKGMADNTPIVSPAGRAHMSLKDLITYGRIHLDGELGSDRFLKTDTWQRLHRPLMNEYAHGWIKPERHGASGPVIWHNGSNTMWYALLMLIPQKNAVLAFVTNNGAVGKAEKAFTQAAKQIATQLT